MIKTKINAEDLITITDQKQLSAELTDINNHILTNKNLSFFINNVNYNHTTDEYGIARLNIRLPIGTYKCTISFNGDSNYESSTITVNVTVVEKYPVEIEAEDLVKSFMEQKQLKCKVTSLGSVLWGKNILFRVNGVTYNRVTDGDGIAGLNIRLPAGTYSCEITSPIDDYYDFKSVTVQVKVISDTFIDGTNIDSYSDEEVVYQCAVYSETNRIQCDVSLTVNGVTYTRHTDNDGLAKLTIRLPAGEYDLIAEFKGDSNYKACKTVNHIIRRERQDRISKIRDNVFYPSENIGFMKSHIQVKQFSPERAQELGGVVFWDDTGQKFHKDIAFESYEIIETDPRVKTAKFVTKEYFDLSAGQVLCHISNPFHENFGGKIKKVNFDEDKKVYTYQCQDGRYNYLSKGVLRFDNIRTYDLIKGMLIMPLYFNMDFNYIDTYVNTRHSKLWSGLRPIEAYNLQTGVIKQNNFAQQTEKKLSYDSMMDAIMNYAHSGGTPTDVYFTPEGVCQIEPMDINKWINTGFKITHNDLVSYKQGFDTTNILTGVSFKKTDPNPIVNVDTGYTLNQELAELGFYFGVNIGLVDPIQDEHGKAYLANKPNTNDISSKIGINKGKTIVVACDRNDENDGHVLGTVCYTLENASYNVINLGIGPSLFSDYDYYDASSGKVGVYLMAGSTVSIADGIDGSGHFDYYVFGLRGDLGLRSTTQFDSAPWGYDDDCTAICDRWVGHTGAEIAQMVRDSGKGDVVVGNSAEEIANAVLSAVNGEGTSNGSSNKKEFTVSPLNVPESYNKGLEEVIKQSRELLTFEVKLPLNHPIFKNLHTNQMLFTELPKDLQLGGLSKLFKILPTWKTSRSLGGDYQENRWYIEKQVIKCDKNGLFSTLTLNVLPSSYSVYAEKLREYRRAYEQEFDKKDNKTHGSGGNTNNNSSSRFGDDSLETGEMACATDRYRGNAGDNENFDNCSKKGYAVQGRSYYNWARQYNSPIELAKALANRFSYSFYYDNADANAEVTHNNGGTIHCNCYDASRLVKCCFDSAGFDCVVITGNIYDGGHAWNAVKHNGRWYTFDLAYWVTGVEWEGTNSLRLADEW